MNMPYLFTETHQKLHQATLVMTQQQWVLRHPLLMEILFFGLKSVLSCSFALSLFVILGVTKQLELTALPRYDLILLLAIGVQVLLVLTKQESIEEVKTICWFHLLGLALEIFKSHPSIGSWAYPEFAVTKFFGAPLYCGFMYASVASFMLQFWRRSTMQLHNHQYPALAMILAALVYLNFFTHHFIGDFRWLLAALLCLCFWRTRVVFTFYRLPLSLPLTLCFALLGALVWLGENIATFYGAWQYPNQTHTWQMVHFGKIGSWGLLVVVTFVLIASLRQRQAKRQ